MAARLHGNQRSERRKVAIPSKAQSERDGSGPPRLGCSLGCSLGKLRGLRSAGRAERVGRRSVSRTGGAATGPAPARPGRRTRATPWLRAATAPQRPRPCAPARPPGWRTNGPQAPPGAVGPLGCLLVPARSLGAPLQNGPHLQLPPAPFRTRVGQSACRTSLRPKPGITSLVAAVTSSAAPPGLSFVVHPLHSQALSIWISTPLGNCLHTTLLHCSLVAVCTLLPLARRSSSFISSPLFGR